MRFFFLGFAMIAAFPVFTQASSPNPCETNSAYAQFDFWIGDWEVRDTNDVLLGKNTIKALDQNCSLQEHWRSAGGGSGHSMNYYNPADSSWNQLWVSSNGVILKLKGGLSADGAMVLRSEEFLYQNTQKAYHQITWVPINSSTVQQLWEIYSLSGEKLGTAFFGIYNRT